MATLVTGCAGFIGYHFTKKYLSNKKKVIGIDNLNNYYSPKLKQYRLRQIKRFKNFKFFKIDINNYKKLEDIFKSQKIKQIIHLAAQPGVRYSYTNPKQYFYSNVVGFYNILELGRSYNVKKIIYASSSSVYGNQKKLPVKENAELSPISFYGSTKQVGEILAKSYADMFKLNIRGIRYFTVYGPYGRPDMALFKFLSKIKKKIPINLYNFGKHKRDFTYIDDAISATIKIVNNNNKGYQIYNISSGASIKLLDFVKSISNNIKDKVKFKFIKSQKGDVLDTFGDISKIKKLNYKPKFNINSGVKKFVKWYEAYK